MLPKAPNLDDEWHPIEPLPAWPERLRRAGAFSWPVLIELAGTLLNAASRYLPFLDVLGSLVWFAGQVWREPTIWRYYQTSILAEAGRDAATWLLAILYSTLGLKHTDRISLYVPERTPKRFTKVGRWSDNERYRASRGRPTYPMDQGVIGKAYEIGECLVRGAEVPDPERDFEAYVSYMEEQWNIPAADVRGFTMRSRSYYAKALQTGLTRYAVLVVESTEEELPYERIKETISNERWQYMFGALKDKLPYISDALRRGI